MMRMAALNIGLTFLGTSSSAPTLTRNHACNALHVDGAIWMFDCGEGAQIQLLKASLRLSKISKIFITHMHGDHVFGLPGVIATASGARCVTEDGEAVETGEPENKASTYLPIDIYGPSSLRRHLRSALKRTHTGVNTKYRVHELLYENEPAELPSARSDEENNLHPHEIMGENLRPNEDGCWEIDLGDAERQFGRVLAAPLRHTIPSMGYVFRESLTVGKLKAELALPHLMRNKEAYAARGVNRPIKLLADLKSGATLNLPDGTVLRPEDYVGPERPGRVIALLGDTCDSIGSAPMLKAARDADLVVHESTNALTSMDRPTVTAASVEELSRSHGHSTPAMAAAFARAVGAKVLALTHFSGRYKGDESEESMRIMDEIKAHVCKEFEGTVFTARDLMTYDVPKREFPTASSS